MVEILRGIDVEFAAGERDFLDGATGIGEDGAGAFVSAEGKKAGEQ